MKENFFIMISLLHGGHYAQLNFLQSASCMEAN